MRPLHARSPSEATAGAAPSAVSVGVSRQPVRCGSGQQRARTNRGSQLIVQSALCVHLRFECRPYADPAMATFDPDEPTRFGAWCDALGYPCARMKPK